MSEQFSVLVVCLGNICRSPLAERLLRLRLDGLLGDRRDAVGMSSAGVRAVVGSPMDAHAAAELRRLGGDPDGFAGRQMTADLAASADLVLTATRTLRSRVLEEAPRALKRTFTIRELAALSGSAGVRERPVKSPADLVARAASWRGSETVDDYDVPDPIGRSAEFHRTVADLLDVDCTRIARAVASAVDLSDVPRTEVS